MDRQPYDKTRLQPTTGSLGTFSGVFTPSVLTILGIILFMRMGYVVGSAGLARSLLIIGLANAISVLTSISLSAVATNLKVKGGGDYYLISRTLGVEFGGAIGIVLCLAQSISIAFYCIGFGEAVAGMIGGVVQIPFQAIAAGAVLFLFVFAWLGADWATRLQYVVMGLLVCALASFFLGGMAKWSFSTLTHNWHSTVAAPGFWVLFAIFFPAVTGFTQGVSMSGDLKDAGKSLPLGTFWAVGISIVVYFGVAVVFSASVPAEDLVVDYDAMKRVARYNFLIDAGVIAATLSSGMASFLGAPRILQALAQDRVFPFLLPLAKGHGPAANPRRAVLLSLCIALGIVAVGNLNLVARVVSMFFLVSYGLLNYATYFEARSASPSFRPRFKWFDARLSLLGWLACLGTMLAIDLSAGLFAVAVLFAVFQYLKRTAGPARWADSNQSYHLQKLREHLMAAADEPEHPRYWRPQMLAVTEAGDEKHKLLRFSSWLEGGSGLTTAVRILVGRGATMMKRREETETELRKQLSENNLSVFPLAVIAPSIENSIESLVQSSGVGPLRVNTVLYNWVQLSEMSTDIKKLQYGRSLRSAFRFGCNIMILSATDTDWDALQELEAKERRIDVWWHGGRTSRLMLLFAYLITRNTAWSEAKIRLLAFGNEKGGQVTLESLEETLNDVRIEAEPLIVPESKLEVVVSQSADAGLVFLPFRLKGTEVVHPMGGQLEDLLFHLPVVALVSAAEDIDLEAEPEAGKPGELAKALDALSDAEQRADKAEKETAEASERVEKSLAQLRSAIEAKADMETLKELQTQIIDARTEQEKLSRKAARALARAAYAARDAEALGWKPPEEKHKEEESEEPEKSS